MSVLGHGVEICTTATRPASAPNGTLIFDTDTSQLLVRVGGSWVNPVSNHNVGGDLSGTYPNPILPSGSVLQFSNRQENTSRNVSGGTPIEYTQMTQTLTTGGNSRVVVQGKFASMQGMGSVTVRSHFNVTLNNSTVIGGGACEWNNNGWEVKEVPIYGVSGVLPAGTYTMRIKNWLSSGSYVQWNWHSYTEQITSVSFMEIKA
jgi:hypothetical protein